MDSGSLRHAFLNFFKERGHTIVPSSSLVPDDPSVLLTTAGMQQFKPYYTGAVDPFVSPHPTLGGKSLGSKNAASIQKSFRTSDIDEVGDERHLTFFEMMGNFSFGGYFKEEAIRYAYDFIVKEVGLKIDYVSVFGGESSVPVDEESERIWKSIDSDLVVKRFGRADNFWGPTGNEGPCGPTTEIYVNGIEIWNIVFNQYFQDRNGNLEPLKTPGIDTGMGLERLAMVSQDKSHVFETDLFSSLQSFLPSGTHSVAFRRTLDHMRAVSFLLADGVRPSNKEAGYVLRRLIRKTVLYEDRYKFSEDALRNILSVITQEYGDFYRELIENQNVILEAFAGEQQKFRKLVSEGRKRIHDLIKKKEEQSHFAVRVKEDFGSKSEHFINLISGDEAFDIYQTFGFPPELIEDELAQYAYSYHKEEFKQAFERAQQKHQEISRAGLERKFGGHGLLLDTGELKAANEEELQIVTRLHTATHLLQAGLRKVLGETVHQAGSDITVERTRFDFTYDRKLTPEELKSAEQLVNEAIEKDLSMEYKEMSFQEAIATGALYSPKEKYPARVKVYSAWNPQTKEVFSRELCGGPHVTHTGEIGKVKIIKEEGVAAGVRRIRAVLE
ncbi:MAG: alanine--tRNA ligase-related protein [bacterium]|nr:alanine--tRNA ligase-related protein [bacterium]